MSKGRSSTVKSIRFPDDVLDAAQARADKRGNSLNEFIVKVLRHEVIRSHHKRKV